ncbi:single-stranded DNA-binding protein [Bacteroidota bacterium]
MNALKNRVQLIGNLGNDPEIKKFENNRTLVKFSLATSENYKNANGEKVQETQWHNIIAWGNVAIIAEKYLKKGNEVAVEGKLVTRSYDSKDGEKKYITEIVVNELLMLRKNNG